MIRILLLLAALALPAKAETARVTSGEHPDFTRLVIELPAGADWTLGRTAMGYGFATATPVQPDYDLSSVWQRIPRNRLQALRIDPEAGALLLTLGCACHVFAFDYLPGTVVLDIRAGAAPAGSAFEAAFSAGAAPLPTGKPPLATAPRAYAWLEQEQGPPELEAFDGLVLPFFPGTASLDPLRDELLLQLSRGAVDGVVDMALPGKPRPPEVESMGDLSGALIRIGAVPGLAIGDTGSDKGAESEGGTACLTDDALALQDWGGGRRPLDVLAEARSGLYGEFDVLAPDALRRTIQLHLYLGFGAEALQYGGLLPGADTDPAIAPLLSMARLMEGSPDPLSPFAPMLACDGAASLWAALAHSGLPAEASLNTDAIVRSFQVLPPHLRRHLGPRLAALLQSRDAEAVRMIRDAIERTPDVSAGTVALIDADRDLQAARPDAALLHAETAVASGGGLLALVALVEAHFQSGQPLPPDVAEALLSHRDMADDAVAQHGRAVVLALALSGRMDEAFSRSAADTRERRDLWQVVADHAEDSAFLMHAVVDPSKAAPAVDPRVALTIATRLSGLGFPDAALVWLGTVGQSDSPERRLVAAKAELARKDARKALDLLSDLAGPEALALQAAAHQQLGAFDAARKALDKAGQADSVARLAAWDTDWAVLETAGSPAWAKAASMLWPDPSDAAGPLGQGRAAIDDSAAARLAIKALLDEVPTPDL